MYAYSMDSGGKKYNGARLQMEWIEILPMGEAGKAETVPVGEDPVNWDLADRCREARILFPIGARHGQEPAGFLAEARTE